MQHLLSMQRALGMLCPALLAVKSPPALVSPLGHTCTSSQILTMAEPAPVLLTFIKDTFFSFFFFFQEMFLLWCLN